MRSADIVILKDVFVQNIMQMLFIENNHMVKTASTKRTDYTFTKRILPGASRGSWCVFHAEFFYLLLEIFAEDFIIVSDDIFGCFIESKSFTKLLNSPLRMWI